MRINAAQCLPDDVGYGDHVVLDNAVRVELSQRDDAIDKIVQLLLLRVFVAVGPQIAEHIARQLAADGADQEVGCGERHQ